MSQKSIKIEMSFRPCLCRIRQLAEQAGFEPESHSTSQIWDRGSMPAFAEVATRRQARDDQTTFETASFFLLS